MSNHHTAMKSLFKKSLRSFVSFLSFHSNLIDETKHEVNAEYLEPEEFWAALKIARQNDEDEIHDPMIYTTNLDNLPNGIRDVRIIVSSYEDKLEPSFRDLGINIRFRHRSLKPADIYECKTANENLRCESPYEQCPDRIIQVGEKYWLIDVDDKFIDEDEKLIDGGVNICQSCIMRSNPVCGRGLIWLQWRDLLNEAERERLLPFTFRGRKYDNLNIFYESMKIDINDHDRIRNDICWLEFPSYEENESEVLANDSKTKPSKKKRGRPIDTNHEKDAILASEWNEAKNSGVSKEDFAKDIGMSIDQVNRAIDRVRKRK